MDSSILQRRLLAAVSAASITVFLLGAAPLSASGAQLVAQAAPAQAPPATSAPPAAPSAAPPAAKARGPVALVERRISDLHKRLHITSAQEPKFGAFADVMRANARTMDDLFKERAQHRDRSAPGMLHWYARLTTAHADGLNKLVPAFDDLYQDLSPAQKKAADSAFQALRQGRPARKSG
jgi:periplasmic protein CpxP/Spy